MIRRIAGSRQKRAVQASRPATSIEKTKSLADVIIWMSWDRYGEDGRVALVLAAASCVVSAATMNR